MPTQIANRTAIVTGANSGIGFSVCRRLLAEEKHDIHIILACRNKGRAEEAIRLLEDEFPGASLELLLCDTGNLGSVLRFCKQVKEKHSSIDLLFCNAGILSTTGVIWSRVPLILVDPVSFANTADALEQRVGEITSEGLGRVFAVNVFGHFAMIRELEDVLERSGNGRIIWTSSLTSHLKYFDAEDYQGIKTQQPYESSKWLTDILSIYMDSQYRAQGRCIHSFLTHPGVVASNIGELARWIVEVRKLLHYALRFYGETTQTIQSSHGSFSNSYVAFEEPVTSLNPHLRYGSHITRWGEEFIETQIVDGYDEKVAKTIMDKMEALRRALSKSYKV